MTDPEARHFYEIEAAENGWSVRELKRQLDSSLYERLALSRDKDEVRRLARDGQVVEKASDLIKDPVVLEFLGLEKKPAYSESDLETAIIDRLQQFLLELGKGFLFEARQKRFSFDESHFFVDLVFYNRLLRCYVLIDLKTGKLTHQDLGQMQMYVNYFDRHVRTDDELPTIGILPLRPEERRRCRDDAPRRRQHLRVEVPVVPAVAERACGSGGEGSAGRSRGGKAGLMSEGQALDATQCAAGWETVKPASSPMAGSGGPTRRPSAAQGAGRPAS